MAGRLPAILLALTIGGAGGYVCFRLNTPLPWMLGSMLTVAAAAIAGAPVDLSLRLRTVMIGVLGALLGSSFTPDVFGRLVHWAGGLALMLLFVGVMTALAVGLFRRVGGFDRVTAFFSGTPGGLGVMTVLGEQEGGDPRTIALVHAMRIFIVVSAIPLYLLVFEHLAVVRGSRALPSAAQAGAYELAVLAACTGAGLLLARLVRLPGGQIIGPMLLSAAAYLGGVVDARPPMPLIALAQVVIGAGIGVRFVGLEVSRMWRPLGYAVLSALMMLAGAGIVAALIAPLLGLDPHALLLALSPGGVAEMSVVALSLHVDTAFVASMHIVRILLIVMLAPLVFRLLGWRRYRVADRPVDAD